jgi:hypothetical protein
MSAPRIDAKEYRQRYLETLAKQIAVNNKNLQANALFKQTQQPTPLEDQRTITEKVADEQQLSALLRREFSKLTDGASANAIVAMLSLDDKKFILENFGGVEDAIRRRFKFGFTAETFRPFFERYAKRVRETEGFEPTATEIAEVVAPATASATAKATSEAIRASQEQLDEATVFEQVFNPQNTPEEVNRMFPPRNKNWISTRDNLIKPNIKFALEDGGVRELQPVKSFIVKNLTKSAKDYRDFFDTLPEDLKNIFYVSVVAYDYPFASAPSASAQEEEPPTEGSGMRKIKGRGLAVAKSQTNGGIKEESRFAQFGRYLIDKNALKNGIATIRFQSGACIHQIPSQKVSGNVQRVLKSIAGGALPSYEDIDALNKEDKGWLYDVSRRSRLGINIPNPKKDEETQEMEEFEKMKGQIIAGNDNKDLVKKFKFTLLKLAKEGRIPKRQANEVLMEMAMVGL